MAHDGVRLCHRIDGLDGKIDGLDRKLRTSARECEETARLMTIPGIGPITPLAIQAFALPMESFRRGRDSSAWPCLVPQQHTTVGKPRLGRISKMGQKDLGRLLFTGAMTVVRHASRRRARSRIRGWPGCLWRASRRRWSRWRSPTGRRAVPVAGRNKVFALAGALAGAAGRVHIPGSASAEAQGRAPVGVSPHGPGDGVAGSVAPRASLRRRCRPGLARRRARTRGTRRESSRGRGSLPGARRRLADPGTVSARRGVEGGEKGAVPPGPRSAKRCRAWIHVAGNGRLGLRRHRGGRPCATLPRGRKTGDARPKVHPR